MLGALSQALNSVHFGSHESKVKRYLNEATPDSVLEDLRKALAPKIREVQDPWTTFEAYCVEDSSHQRYWNVTSFREHIERKHPDVASSEAVVQLLWRCFLYFAYHPFPRDVTNSKVDLSGFQRAVSLLAVQGTDILGTQEEGDYFWRHNDVFFRRADFQRTFRSIGLPDGPNNQPTDSNLEEDVMDVLAMTQPQSVSLAPSPDQLGPAARKLLGEGPTRTRYRVTRRDFSTLLSLLLRLRLHKAKWGSYFHYGTFDNAEPGDEELANILVNGLGEVHDGENIASEQLLRAMDLLPNLNLRFHQLWAVLFQPPMSADDQMLSQAPDPLGAVPDRILRAIALFIPHPEFSTRTQTTMQDVRIALEKSTQSSQRPDDLTVTRLVKALKNDAHPHLMLLTSDGTTTPATVVGAYFPGPLWLEANGREMCEFKTGTSHLLFQLEPQFRLLRWTCPDIPLTDIVNTHEEALSLEAIAASDQTSPTSNKAYWIGDPERIGPGLQIDPETRSALLTSNFTDANIEGVAWYNDVGRDSDRGDKAPKKHWEVTVKLGLLNFFRVSCGIDADLATGRIIRAKDQARYMREATKPRIEGEELKKRIQGFGSTS